MDPDEEFEELADDEGDGDAFDEGEEGGDLAEEHVAEEDLEDEEAPAICSGPDTSLRAFRGHGDSVYAVDVSPDGALAISGSGDDTAALWRLADCSLVATLPASADTVSCVAFNASGRLVALGSYDSLVRVYSVASLLAGGGGGGSGGGGGGGAAAALAPAPLHLLEGPAEGVECVSWHPKGDVLLAGSSDGTAWMWSAGERGAASCMQVFAGHGGGVSSAAFSRDGRLALTASEDGSVRAWNPKSAACVKVFDFGEAPVTSISTSPLDGNLVCAAAMDGAARLLHLEGKRVVHTVSHHEGGGGAAAGGGGGRSAAEGDAEEGSTSVECSAFCATHPWLATGSTNGVVLVTDLASSTTRHRFVVPGGVIRLAWVPGAAPLLAAATAHGLVRVFDARDGSVTADLTGHEGMVLDVCVTAAGVVTAGDDGVCRVYAPVGAGAGAAKPPVMGMD